ncbi:MAG TPA: hypothetical protein VJ372_22455 [Pyrinomonadaceae bacterium]|jgi:Uncharacterized membrane protein|nr:hypothetical protein [Pyrinomonadaceae bacterium]
MNASLALVLLVTISGTVTTYLYDEDAPFAARLCAGACIGIAVLGLVGFVTASFLGLTPTALWLTAIICALPLAILTQPSYATAVRDDLSEISKAMRRLTSKPEGTTIGYVSFYLVAALILWQVFSKAMIEDATGISTGLLNNFGDLPFHLSVITGFAYGNNFPPEDPTYAGVRFTYPFLSDFVSAMFVTAGADLRQSMFIENFVLALSFIGLLHRWALVMLKDRLAAIITPLLVLLNGGFGWVLLFTKADNENGMLGAIHNVPSFTVIPETTWRWGNAISALLIPQRGFLMGLPLAVIVFTQWWLATNKTEEPPQLATAKKNRQRLKKPVREIDSSGSPWSQSSIRRMVAAGLVAGLLPLAHAHSFVVVMAMGGCLALIQRRWREWFTFFFVGSVVAIPQLWWSTSHTAVNAGSFFAWEIGWDRGNENPVWFWFKNTGLFIPLILVAILARGKDYIINKRVLLFYLPFTLCFVVPNFIKMAPWIWDNIKVLFYWWVASAPLVALLLSRLWKDGPIRRSMAVVLFICLTFAGGLDLAVIGLSSVKYGVFDSAGVRFAELVKSTTPPRALIVHAPVHNEPVFLTGRKSLMGYPGHIWTHGLDFVKRESDIKRLYAGTADAEQILNDYSVDYAVVGPLERLVMPVNDQFFSRYEKVGEVGGYQLYKIKP